MKPLDEPEVGAWLQKVAEDYRVAEMLAQSKTQVLAYRCVHRVVGAGPPAPFEARKAGAKAPGAQSLYGRPVRRARAELGKQPPEFRIG